MVHNKLINDPEYITKPKMNFTPMFKAIAIFSLALLVIFLWPKFNQLERVLLRTKKMHAYADGDINNAILIFESDGDKLKITDKGIAYYGLSGKGSSYHNRQYWVIRHMQDEIFVSGVLKNPKIIESATDKDIQIYVELMARGEISGMISNGLLGIDRHGDFSEVAHADLIRDRFLPIIGRDIILQKGEVYWLIAVRQYMSRNGRNLSIYSNDKFNKLFNSLLQEYKVHIGNRSDVPSERNVRKILIDFIPYIAAGYIVSSDNISEEDLLNKVQKFISVNYIQKFRKG